jgi:hypothetical protein
MVVAKAKRFPQQVAISVTLFFGGTLAAYAWPNLLTRPQLFATIELAVFFVAVGVIKQHWRREAQTATALTVGRRLSTSVSEKVPRSEPPIPPINWTFDTLWPDADECERLSVSFQWRAAWDSPAQRVSWILLSTYKFDSAVQKVIQPFTEELQYYARILFVENADETKHLREVLLNTAPRYEMLLLEDEPAVGALVEDVFQEYGVWVRRLPMPPVVENKIRETSGRLRGHSERLATCFTVRFTDSREWPMFPVSCLEQDRVLHELLPTKVAGISDRYFGFVQRYLSTVVALGQLLKGHDHER